MKENHGPCRDEFRKNNHGIDSAINDTTCGKVLLSSFHLNGHTSQEGEGGEGA